MRFSDKNVWQRIKLNEYADFLQGLTYSPNNVSTTGKLVLRSSNIQNSKLAFDDNVYVNMNIPAKISTKENDVLMCVRNGSKNLVGKTALITKEFENLAWGAFMNIIRPKDGKTLLFHFLNSQYFKNQIKADLNTATVNQITIGTLNQCKISIPLSEVEKDKLCIFFNLLDQRIDTQNKIIEKYESLIKVINQMMCNFDHEKIQVQNVFDFKEKTKHQANMGNSQGNFIYFTNEESTYKYFDSYDFDGEYIIANTGGKANFKYYNGKFAVMSDCLVMECNDNQNTKFYLYSILNRIDYINQVCFVGSGLKHLDKKLFLKTFITKFNKNLEPFINLIILLEKKISNDKILLQKLKEQKKYLLSNMFI